MQKSPQSIPDLSRAAPDISAWLVAEGLAGASQEELLEGYCARLVEAGVSVHRVHVAHRALHPVFGGLGFDWFRGKANVARAQYDRVPVPREVWVTSPFFYMLKEGVLEVRERLTADRPTHQFPIFDELRDQGATDYLAVMRPFSAIPLDQPTDPNKPPEGMIISWTSVVRHHRQPGDRCDDGLVAGGGHTHPAQSG